MKSLMLIGGGLLALVGIIFALQGAGAIGGSAMSGVTFWAWAGPVIAVAGVAIALFGLRQRPGP
jgi:drug/metabolite transporter superfamily protein YnfA